MARRMITLGIPTRGRPDELSICFESAYSTATNPDNIRFVLLFGDDEEGYNKWNRYTIDDPLLHVFLSTPRRYYYSDLYLLYQHMHEVGDLDLFVIANDDCEFVVGGWDKSAEEQLYENFDDGMGVLSFWQHPFHTYMSQAKLFDEQYDGILAPEDYVFYFGDSERHADLTERGQWARSVPDLIKHPMMAQTDTEAVHSRNAWYERDKRVYEKRMKERERVRALEEYWENHAPKYTLTPK